MSYNTVVADTRISGNSLHLSEPAGAPELTVLLPARNEARSLETLIPRLRSTLPDAEVIVVDDGSSDGTRDVALAGGAAVISHPVSLGNGAAIKTGARAARGRILVCMDADGQHDPGDIPRLLEALRNGSVMVVGERRFASHANIGRGLANRIYNWFAGWMVGHRIGDLTSGLRAARSAQFREFLSLLPNGFSYPTTITMAFFRAGYFVSYVPITAARREGQSHIRPIRDGVRFLLIIFKIGTLYSPLKLFTPISLTFLVTAIGYYGYTFLEHGRFTNMSALLFSVAVIIFLIGLVSEQITQLVYLKARE